MTDGMYEGYMGRDNTSYPLEINMQFKGRAIQGSAFYKKVGFEFQNGEIKGDEITFTLLGEDGTIEIKFKGERLINNNIVGKFYQGSYCGGFLLVKDFEPWCQK